jgi:nitrate reductase delta subunit
MSGALQRGRLRARAGDGARRARRGREEHRRTAYKLCSLALQYPDEELLGMGPQMAEAAAALAGPPAGSALGRFLAWWQDEELLALQAHYVETFDMHKRCGLYLTFYTDGDRRDRGLALLRLRKLYRAAGLPMASGELPDFLPVMLEFAAAAPPAYAEVPLREQRAALELLRDALHERSTPYAHVLDAICATLGAPSAGERAQAARLALAGPPRELVGVGPELPPSALDTGGAAAAAAGAGA